MPSGRVTSGHGAQDAVPFRMVFAGAFEQAGGVVYGELQPIGLRQHLRITAGAAEVGTEFCDHGTGAFQKSRTPVQKFRGGQYQKSAYPLHLGTGRRETFDQVGRRHGYLALAARASEIMPRLMARESG